MASAMKKNIQKLHSNTIQILYIMIKSHKTNQIDILIEMASKIGKTRSSQIIRSEGKDQLTFREWISWSLCQKYGSTQLILRINMTCNHWWKPLKRYCHVMLEQTLSRNWWVNCEIKLKIVWYRSIYIVASMRWKKVIYIVIVWL